tara:strand:- start:76 stop:534 length:459 start_codon:yes stop_codon:yes gene_type:complete
MKELKAEEIYNTYLKKVYILIGDQTTYLSQLLGVGKKLLKVKFKGVYPSDKIPRLNDLSPYCILNLDKSSQSGSHWVALAKLPYPSTDSMIYDSFGRDYKRILPNVIYSGNGKIKNTDRDVEQKILQTDCGARCLAWLMIFDKHGPNVAKMI